MTEKATPFQERFDRAFDRGLSDIKLFVRRDREASVEDLKNEAAAFQKAIDEGKTTPVDGVD